MALNDRSKIVVTNIEEEMKTSRRFSTAALALEISASAAMATAGSENFFRAHFERGGIRS